MTKTSTTTTCAAYKCTHEVNADVSPWCDNHRPEWAVVVTTDPTPWRFWPQYGQNEVSEIRFETRAQAIAYGASGGVVYAPRTEGYELA